MGVKPFLEGVKLVFVQIPYSLPELRHLIKLFIKLDTSGNGLLSAEELATWFESDYPGIVSSVFFRFIFDLVACRSPEGACAEEFFAIINHICTMNEEELTRHVFDQLAKNEDHLREKYCDLATVQQRCLLPHLLDTLLMTMSL